VIEDTVMTERIDVVGVGYTALDYLGIIPHFPREDRKLEIGDFTIQGGGPTATAVVTVKRLGLSAAFIGKVGDDDFGRRMLEELQVEGVDVSRVVVEQGGRSQFAFIMVDERTAARTILWTRGSLGVFTGDEVDCGAVARARGLLVDSLEPAAALAAAGAARKASIPVVIDAGTLREGVRELLPLCDYIVASELFAEQVADGAGHEEALERMLSFGARAAVVTRGAGGCAALSPSGFVEVPGFSIETVDTTGAGDVFHGAFMFGVLRGWDIKRICLFSNAVAALKCRRLGGRAGIPSLEEALAFLSREVPDEIF
jgi:sulfofructose kinase